MRLTYTSALLLPLLFAPHASAQPCTIDPCPDLVAIDEDVGVYGTGGNDSDLDANGIRDDWEMALFNAILCNTEHPLHDIAACTLLDNGVMWNNETIILPAKFQREWISACATISTTFLPPVQWFMRLTAGEPHYEFLDYAPAAVEGMQPFSASGDVDGDGATNGDEAANIKGILGTREQYTIAALDPARDGSEWPFTGECTGWDGPCPGIVADGIELYEFADWDVDTHDVTADGIPDIWQVALFQDVLCNSQRAPGAPCIFLRNFELYQNESGYFPHFFTALTTMSTSTRDLVVASSSLEATYIVFTVTGAKNMEEPFAADGDLDADGFSNLDEYLNSANAGLTMNDYVAAAQNPLSDGSGPISDLPLTPSPLAAIIALLGIIAQRAIRQPKPAPTRRLPSSLQTDLPVRAGSVSDPRRVRVHLPQRQLPHSGLKRDNATTHDTATPRQPTSNPPALRPERPQ